VRRHPPTKATVAAWTRIYLAHGRDADDPRKCAARNCWGRFPCQTRMEAAELLIVCGVGVPAAVAGP